MIYGYYKKPTRLQERRERLARMKIDTKSQINNSPRMANMGIKRKDLEPKSSFGIAIAASPDESDKKRSEEVKFPSFDLTNKHIEAAGLSDVNPDDVVEFTVKARITSVKKKSKTSPDSYDSDRVELEVQDISDVKMIDSTEPEETDEEKDTASKLGFSAKNISKGGGNLSPKSAGVKL